MEKISGENKMKDDKPKQEDYRNPINQVFFRAGLLACREYMARFIEAQNPQYAASIRSNWWPSLGDDPGPPRQIEWGEITEGEYGTDSFREKTAEEVSASIEALPIALAFLSPKQPPLDGKED
jgi:hypothetical protein